MFHIMTGDKNRSAIWMAQRVPDDEVAVIPNGFIIRKINLEDPGLYRGGSVHRLGGEKPGW